MKNIDCTDIVLIGDRKNSKNVIIWFHGYGANNWDMEPVMEMLNMVCNNSFFILLPNAPVVNGKRSWYPLPNTNHDNIIVEDYDGLISTHEKVKKFITEFKDNNPNLFDKKKIIFGGFSQGGALALSLHLASNIPSLGGISIAGYMPCANHFEHIDMSDKKIFLAHGEKDLTISIDTHHKTLRFLKQKNVDVSEFTSIFGHTMTKEVIMKTSYWLKNYYGSL